MSEYGEQTFEFTSDGGRNVEGVFDEPAVTSDGGALVVRELLERSELLADLAKIVEDERRAGSSPALCLRACEATLGTASTGTSAGAAVRRGTVPIRTSPGICISIAAISPCSGGTMPA